MKTVEGNINWIEDVNTPLLRCPECEKVLKPHNYILRGYCKRVPVAAIRWDSFKQEFEGTFLFTNKVIRVTTLDEAKIILEEALVQWMDVAGMSFKTAPESKTMVEKEAVDEEH